MSAIESSPITAIAFQLAAAVEAYELDLERVPSRQLDPELHHSLGQQMDTMRLYAATLPRVSVPGVELLIRHFELTHSVWRQAKGELTQAEVAQLHDNARHAAQRLRQHCLHLIAAPEDAAGGD